MAALLTQFVSTSGAVSTNFITSTIANTLNFATSTTPGSSFLITDNSASSAPSWEAFLSTWDNALPNWEILL
jgi:hypothetical protein